MKKYISITALLVAGTAFANATTNVTVEETITLDGTQATDTRLDFSYSTNAAQSVTTTVDSVTIYGTDGYGLNTAGASLTFDIQNTLTATNAIKLGTEADFKVYVKTNLSESELTSFEAGNFVSRWVVTTDYFNSVNGDNGVKIQNITLGNVADYDLTAGGLIFDCNGSYYAASDISFSGNYATVNSGAETLTLEKGVLYTTAKITASSGASVKGIGFVAAIPEPSAFGLLAGLGALALVGTRRRRR